MWFWSKIPLVRLVIPFSIGIFLATLFRLSVSLFFVYLFILLLSAFTFYSFTVVKSYRNRWIPGVIASILFLFLGFLLANLHKQKNGNDLKNFSKNERQEWIGKVVELNVREDSSTIAIVEIMGLRKEENWQKQSGKISTYCKSVKKLKTGDVIYVNSFLNKIESPLNPYQFDYAKFMSNRGIYSQSFVDSLVILSHQQTIYTIADYVRNQLIQNFVFLGFQENELAVLSAISLGDKSSLDNSLQEAYAGAGAMHILAVSGLHVGIVFMIFNQLFKFFKETNWQRWVKAVLLLLVIWGFAFLTGLSPSVQRAACMFSFVIFAKALNRHSDILNSIAGAAFLLLVINPTLLFEVGFQLSFAAVIGIVSLHPIIYSCFQTRFWLIDKAWSLIVVSFCAQIATLPFIFFYFHQFPNWFLVTNLIVIPLAFTIVAGALLVAVVYLIFDQAFGLEVILKALVQFLNYIIERMKELPYFQTKGIWLEDSSILFLAISLVFIGFYLHHKKYNFLFVSLSSFAILLTIQLAKQIELRKSSFIGFYAFKNEPIYLIKKAQTAFVYRSEKTLSNFSKETILNHLDAIHINQKNVKYFRMLELDNMASYKELNGLRIINNLGKLIFILNDNKIEYSTQFLNLADIIIIENEKALGLLDLNETSVRTIIIGTNVKPWSKKLNAFKAEVKAKNKEITYIELLKEGFFRVEV